MQEYKIFRSKDSERYIEIGIDTGEISLGISFHFFLQQLIINLGIFYIAAYFKRNFD